jgi:hypothetical protein
MIYDIHIGSYIGIINESISILSILIFLITFLIKRRKKQ